MMNRKAFFKHITTSSDEHLGKNYKTSTKNTYVNFNKNKCNDSCFYKYQQPPKDCISSKQQIIHPINHYLPLLP